MLRTQLTAAEPSEIGSLASGPSAWAYVLPMAGFVGLTSLEGLFSGAGGAPHPVWYPVAYTLKIVIVSALACCGRRAWRDLRPLPTAAGLGLAVGLGLLVALGWVGLDGRYPAIPLLGRRSAFDPSVLPAAGRYGFLAVRLFGLVALVPLIEELFWRSFAIRWVIDVDFARVPVGRVTPTAALLTALGFGLAHPEWLPAFITALAWAWLLRRTRSVLACVVSHSAANLALGVYVLAADAWKYW